MAQQFQINRGINRSIEFKGIKAQYITYLCMGLIVLLLLFVILYVFGVNSYICLAIIVPLALIWYLIIQQYSKKYGEHGLTKMSTKKRLPDFIVTRSRVCFTILSSSDHEACEKNGGRVTRMES